MRSRLTIALAVILALALTGCGSDGKFTGHRLEHPWPASPLTLTSTDGSAYSLAKDTQKDPLTLVFFGYTNCKDFCPIVMNNIAAAFNRLDDSDREHTGMVFVTSDPARDSTSVLRRYLDGYNKSFVGLTGPLSRIIRVGNPLKVYVNNGKKLPSGGYDPGGHSTYVLGLKHGEAVVMWQESTSAPQFASDIHTLLSED